MFDRNTLFITGGFALDGFELSAVEIVILDNINSTNCTALTPASYPLEGYNSVGGLILENETTGALPLVCGGKSDSGEILSRCFKYDNTEWVEISPMLKRRQYAIGIQLAPDKFWITGGQDENGVNLHSTEILDGRDGQFKSGPDLPHPSRSHCLSWVNQTHIALSGGARGGGGDTSEFYFFNVETEQWAEGPMVNVFFSRHSRIFPL